MDSCNYKLLLYFILPISLGTPAFAQIPTLPKYSTEYSAKRDPFQDGRDAIKLASKTNRKVLLEVGGDWCTWCHILDRFIKQNKDIYKQLHQTFVVLKVNVSDNNGNEKFLARFPKFFGYPHMFISSSEGKVLHSQDTAEFLVNGKYSRQKMLQFINKWQQNAK